MRRRAVPVGGGVVAGVTGLEPAASGVTGQRSNQLSYTPLLRYFSTSSLHRVSSGPILGGEAKNCQEKVYLKSA